MKAVVLVGGFGTRLRPLTLLTPKQMLPVVDRPMIEWVIGHLACHGVDEVTLSLGFRPDVFTEQYPDDRIADVPVVYAVEDEPLDTAGAIAFAARTAGYLDGGEAFLAVNGDVLTDLDVSALISVHNASGSLGTLHLTPVDDPSRYGVVSIDDTGKVLEFVEKPPAGQAPSNWINAGTYVLEPGALAAVPTSGRCSIEREIFPALVAERQLSAWPDDAYWIDTGTPETYIQAQLDLVEGRRGVARLEAIAGSAEVSPSASIEHSVVMAGASVADNVSLRGSVVMPGASLEAGASVEDSVVGPGAIVGEGARVSGFTLIGDRTRVPSGTRLAEARVPEPEPV